MQILTKLKKHWIRSLFALVGIVILALAFMMFRPDTYLPHERIVLRVPYNISEPPISILPMGEKIYHPDSPKGHPGIDFQWAGPDAKVLSSSNGKISSIKLVNDKWNKWDMTVSSGPYIVRYKEMENYNTKLKVGHHVSAGDFLGYPANPKIHNQVGAYQIHWEFASPSPIRDRFCPMTYFDEESRKSIEAIWSTSTWQYKSQYPHICSGGYFNKTE